MMKQYCYRAECPIDEVRLMLELPREEVVSVERTETPLGGYASLLTVRTLTLEQVRDFMRQVEDGHVMVQTVQPPKLYTGERDWDLL
jgi:hypothetical protein